MSGIRFELTTSTEDLRAYFALRKAIFCQEQQMFSGIDIDDTDRTAYPIVARVNGTAGSDQIVGVVRIYETQPGWWYGGRLGVHPDHRRHCQIGRGLIHKAVTTANSWGCTRFRATVQMQNVRFFARLHWHSLEEVTLCGRLHHLMEADLAYYPPSNERRPVPLLLCEIH